MGKPETKKRIIRAREIAADKFLEGLCNALEHGSPEKLERLVELAWLVQKETELGVQGIVYEPKSEAERQQIKAGIDALSLEYHSNIVRVAIGANDLVDNPVYFYRVDGKLDAAGSQHIDADRIIRVAGGSPETHELHQQGYEYGHPLTGRVDISRFTRLTVITKEEAAAAALPGGFKSAETTDSR